MFNSVNGMNYIDGSQGKYDGKVKNNSVRYARNSVDNCMKFFEKYNAERHDKLENGHKLFGLDNPDLDKDTFEKKLGEYKEYLEENIKDPQFTMKYAENKDGKADIMAVLGVAYEELGGKTAIKTDELTQILRKGISEKNKENFSADSLDLDSNGEIDIAEYGASILVEDMLSTDSSVLNAKNVNGEITNEGQDKLITFAAKNHYNKAKATYQAVYNDFGLKEGKNIFLNDPNNLVN